MKKTDLHQILNSLLLALSLFLISFITFHWLQKSAFLLDEKVTQSPLIKAQNISNLMTPELQLMDYPEDSLMLFIHPQAPQLQIDGYTQDWQDSLLLRGGVQINLTSEQNLKVFASETPAFLNLLITVQDQYLVYRNAQFPNPKQADYISLKLKETGDEYILSGFSATKISAINFHKMQRVLEIKGVWRESEKGYDVEIQIPKDWIKHNLWLAVGDIDDPEMRDMQTQIGGKNIVLIHQNQYLKTKLAHLNNLDYRVRVLDQKGWIIADKKPINPLGINKNRDFKSMANLLINRFLGHLNRPFKPDNMNDLRLVLKKAGIYTYQTLQAEKLLTRVFYPLPNQQGMIVIDQQHRRLLVTNKYLMGILIFFILTLTGFIYLIKSLVLIMSIDR